MHASDGVEIVQRAFRCFGDHRVAQTALPMHVQAALALAFLGRASELARIQIYCGQHDERDCDAAQRGNLNAALSVILEKAIYRPAGTS